MTFHFFLCVIVERLIKETVCIQTIAIIVYHLMNLIIESYYQQKENTFSTFVSMLLAVGFPHWSKYRPTVLSLDNAACPSLHFVRPQKPTLN